MSMTNFLAICKPPVNHRHFYPYFSSTSPFYAKKQKKGLTQKSAKKRTFGVSPLWFLYILQNGTKL
ncbi:hypothetical protein, partial [Geobacillus stearothermophilus]|uniref:hypothetical protein n=1 Tax=Geobacillus stearothermophilus TaxID=1422 RepID=UPI002E224255|nr:hypothetical protein [Geobacillus stearothermophilus]